MGGGREKAIDHRVLRVMDAEHMAQGGRHIAVRRRTKTVKYDSYILLSFFSPVSY